MDNADEAKASVDLEPMETDTTEIATKTVPETISEPILESISEPIPEQISEPMSELISEPISESITEPITESIPLESDQIDGVVEKIEDDEITEQPTQNDVVNGNGEPELDDDKDKEAEQVDASETNVPEPDDDELPEIIKEESECVMEVDLHDEDDSTAKKSNKKGDDDDLCIIPDTEREITQEEKDKATALKESEKEVVNGDASNDEFQLPEGVEKIEPVQEQCAKCVETKACVYKATDEGKVTYACSDECLKALKGIDAPRPTIKCKNLETERRKEITVPLIFARKCADCETEIGDDSSIFAWELMEFCQEDCLSKYQNRIGSKCASCDLECPTASVGKYCVRFGADIRQFCSSVCLDNFKRCLKICSYCQKDISNSEGFLAPVGDKGQFKDFCTQVCMEKHELMGKNEPAKKEVAKCAVCGKEKTVRSEINVGELKHQLCSEPCFVAFKFANNVSPEQCEQCNIYFQLETLDYTKAIDKKTYNFCCRTCLNIYIILNRKIVHCIGCKVKKYNFDMIQKTTATQTLLVCSLNCYTVYQNQLKAAAAAAKRVQCAHCSTLSTVKYTLNQPDGSSCKFCSYSCYTTYQQKLQEPKRNATPSAKRTGYRSRTVREPSPLPVISDVKSIAKETPTSRSRREPTRESPVPKDVARESRKQKPTIAPKKETPTVASAAVTVPKPIPIPTVISVPTVSPIRSADTGTQSGYDYSLIGGGGDGKYKFIQQLIVKPPAPVDIKNKSTMCRPNTHTKGISFRPHMSTKETQTDDSLSKKVIIPVPIPIYVPTPLAMYSTPFPVPVPIPIPVPIPVFVPTTRNSAQGIMKEIKKIQVKIPTDPFEAEILMMAEMVAGDKKIENTDSESDEDEDGFNQDESNAFGDDVFQMAIKMASERLDEPEVDLEGALTANTITASQGTMETHGIEDPDHLQQQLIMEARNRGRKRQQRPPQNVGGKRGRPTHQNYMPPPAALPEAPPEPVEKPDANMCLKYTFGVNAWKQWVTTKNAELEKSSRRPKLFKSEILQLTSDELNYSLCLFVKEVRKPNGSEYAPDTIYYLCLGIQQYLFENGRIDNIFTDPYYEKFTDCLDEVARKFSVLYNDSNYIVTRVEEEHLWESKQLGAHSPHVLLSTLMFFNTKHFNLTTVDEHMQLSFSHIMKHWKRNPNAPGATKAPSSRNVLLRFYPPQNALQDSDGALRKKKVYEQQENEENPLRCPVKLYEFYLSKCPESVKTRNDVFYLQPERSCVPDSPVWYSTMPLGRPALEKMLHRVKMVKEINVALLTS